MNDRHIASAKALLGGVLLRPSPWSTGRWLADEGAIP